ncbi:MAG: ATP-binding protein [Acidimicrobiales bacterium]
MGRVVELEIPARSDYLALVRLVVSASAGLIPDLPDRRVDDLRLAVSEACANAMDAQRRHATDAQVLITVELDGDEVAVTVTDRAGGFEPDAVDPIPAIDDPGRLSHERGLGIALMRSLTDSVTFSPTGDGTSVRLVVTGTSRATGGT